MSTPTITDTAQTDAPALDECPTCGAHDNRACDTPSGRDHAPRRPLRKLARACHEFNARIPVGGLVRYWTGTRTGDGNVAKTRTPASILSGHTAVIWVEGEPACITLTHVEALRCKCCLTRTGTTTDVYGDKKPVCAWCMDRLDRERWAAEHGMPLPAPGALWPTQRDSGRLVTETNEGLTDA